MQVSWFNLGSMAYRHYSYHVNQMGVHMERLATGQRINRAADDPAGLSISEKMRAQIRGLHMASRNAQDTISMLQTAEGALNEAQSIIQRMRELAVQAANDTNSSSDRTAITEEVKQLEDELNRISKSSAFNEQQLLDGTFNNKHFQIGPNSGDSITISIGSASTTALGIAGIHTKFSDHTNASSAIDALDKALQTVSRQRSSIGAYTNRLEHTINNLDNMAENLTAAESRIRDADMAKEMMEYTKHSILAQMAQIMMVHSRRNAELVLKLLEDSLYANKPSR
ncbi:flagellin [Aneurinibacillus uraniidurans]|uniref:flagellin N-terminal helical domain-containing protein n=1 Tax=Aneurinibacillus uraniidurans TaxID=2966586 RepID=UPI00234A01DF|nr:flagellin [Aneurinibacillus sp. B1]WCN37132.1 flagellin [Aneurinibacillus sp. B1]